MNEDQIYVTIKFVTGDTCVGALMENNPLSVVIANPITITTGLDQQDGEMVERLVMNKFCYLTDDQFFTFSELIHDKRLCIFVRPYANQDWSPGPLGFTSIFL